MRTNGERRVQWCSLTLLLIGALHGAGCTSIFSGVSVVHELLTSESYTVTFRVNADADKVYASLSEYARANNRKNLPIFKDDAIKRQFEAGHRREYWAWKVWPADGGSLVTFSATRREQSPEEVRETVRTVLKKFFDEYGFEYTYVD